MSKSFAIQTVQLALESCLLSSRSNSILSDTFSQISAYNQEVVLTERVYRYLVCSTLPCIQLEIGHNSRHDNAFRSIFLENDDINQTSTKSPHPIVCSATWAKGLHESRDMHWQHGLLVDMGGDTTSALEPSR
eukprot:scaffold358_cov207-Alexandrium_tamarense.AAC.40